MTNGINSYSTTYKPCLNLIQVERLLACSLRVAHRQLLGKYPRSLSIRSIVWRGEGFSPISDIKSVKSCHLSHTLIPRPPYRWKCVFLGFPQRCFIQVQALYIRLSAKPCFAALRADSFCKQPQERHLFFFKVLPTATLLLPQSQRHSHCGLPNLSLWARPKTKSLSNRLPVKSMNRPIDANIVEHNRRTQGISL